jgi:hypothetical protein
MLAQEATGQQSLSCQKIEPMQRGRSHRRCSAPTLHALGLQHLADIEQRGKILRLGIIPQQVLVDQGVADRALLVREHHRREDPGAILGRSCRTRRSASPGRIGIRTPRQSGNGSSRRSANGFLAVPDAPVVLIAGFVRGRRRLVVGARRTRPVRRLRDRVSFTAWPRMPLEIVR